MNKVIISTKLTNFLKCEGVYEIYLERLKEYHPKGSPWLLRSISTSFQWDTTKEGREFWNKLDEKYKKL